MLFFDPDVNKVVTAEKKCSELGSSLDCKGIQKRKKKRKQAKKSRRRNRKSL